MLLLKPTTNRRWNELIGLVWLGLALMVFLSLVSFSSSDRSFHTASASLTSLNWVGTVGAHSADLFYQLFGLCAFLLPLDAVALITYGKGYYRMRDMLAPGSLISIVWIVWITLLMLVLGPYLGID